jgi:hypothetical protein
MNKTLIANETNNKNIPWKPMYNFKIKDPQNNDTRFLTPIK